MLLLLKGIVPKTTESRQGIQKVPRPYQKNGHNSGAVQKRKTKGNGEKNIARVKCYNCGKEGHIARDCPEPPKVPLSSHTPKLFVCSHALVANSLPNWIVNTGAGKHIVRDKDGFMDFHCYPVGS